MKNQIKSKQDFNSLFEHKEPSVLNSTEANEYFNEFQKEMFDKFNNS